MLEPDPPALLFVESAWRGNGGAWRLHMTGGQGGPSAELKALVAWFRQLLFYGEPFVHAEA